MGAPLELAGPYKRTEKGNVDYYYGGGDIGYVNAAAACAGVPLAIRPGKTVGVIENNKIVEYIWHPNDVSDSGLVKKTADFSAGAQLGQTSSLTGRPVFAVENNGDYDSETIWGQASNGGVVRLMAFRAGGERGQNGAPAGRFPMRMEGYFGYNWYIPSKVANTGGVNHYSFNVADGTELFYVDNMGTIRMAVPGDTAVAADSLLAIDSNGRLKKLDQSGLQATGITLTGLASVAGTPVATDNLLTAFSKFKYLYDNLGMLVRGVTLATLDLTSSAAVTATDTIIQAFGKLQVQISNKVDKVSGKSLVADTDITKLGKVLLGYDLSFTNGGKDARVCHEQTYTISSILTDGVAALMYSTDSGATYKPVTLPFTGTLTLTVPGPTWVRWRITFNTGVTGAGVHIKLQ
jgi:hypothetical protein